jgi:hypothetical protein
MDWARRYNNRDATIQESTKQHGLGKTSPKSGDPDRLPVTTTGRKEGALWETLEHVSTVKDRENLIRTFFRGLVSGLRRRICRGN